MGEYYSMGLGKVTMEMVIICGVLCLLFHGTFFVAQYLDAVPIFFIYFLHFVIFCFSHHSVLNVNIHKHALASDAHLIRAILQNTAKNITRNRIYTGKIWNPVFQSRTLIINTVNYFSLSIFIELPYLRETHLKKQTHQVLGYRPSTAPNLDANLIDEDPGIFCYLRRH